MTKQIFLEHILSQLQSNVIKTPESFGELHESHSPL